MTEEQSNFLEKLIYDMRVWHGFSEDSDFVNGYRSGFRAALIPKPLKLMTPEQAKHIPSVKALVEALEEINRTDHDCSIDCGVALQALAPFRDED